MTAKFQPGRLVATPGALEVLAQSGQEPTFFLKRHLQGDWGEVDADDWSLNDQTLLDGSRILSAYRLRFGEKVATPDPRDIEAMKAFQAQGGVIVAGLSKGEWANVKRAGAVLPAGQICPTAKPYSSDPDAKPADFVPEENWTEAIKNIAAYARFLAEG